MIVQGESRAKTCFRLCRAAANHGLVKQEAKNAQAMEQRVERLSLLRLSRVARESKAKPSDGAASGEAEQTTAEKA